MIPIRCTRFFSSLLIVLALSLPAQAGRYQYTFFEGTQYPLSVTFLTGEMEGPTAMVQGGIQGDEPSGYISAQILTRATITKGRVIIVPRANVPSINQRTRQINVDMNRRFDQDYNLFYEDRLARVVRFLLTQSDALIHLHEGSGFYDPIYRDALRNPKRYGQSIIVDTLSYAGFELGRVADDVLNEINPGITPEKYQFKLFNTQTFDENTDYAQMRKSLTCYALTAEQIPALAVEVSKNINQLAWKVKRQLEATVSLLHKYGVEVEVPEVTDEEVLRYAEQGVGVRVNGRLLKPGQTIDLVAGSPLAIEPEGGKGNDFSPSLAVFASDRPDVNLLTAPRLALESFSGLELRSDGTRLAKAKVRFVGTMPADPKDNDPVFVCWLNGNPVFIRSGESLRTVKGDQLILEGVWGSRRKEVLNLKGYVAKPGTNDGQDMGFEIILDPENFMEKYQIKDSPEGVTRFRVARETNGARIGEFFVDVVERKVHAVRLTDAHGQSLVVPWTPDGEYKLPPGRYVLEDAWSNGATEKLVPTANDWPIRTGDTFEVAQDRPTTLVLRQATTFGPIGTMVFRASDIAQR